MNWLKNNNKTKQNKNKNKNKKQKTNKQTTQQTNKQTTSICEMLHLHMFLQSNTCISSHGTFFLTIIMLCTMTSIILITYANTLGDSHMP